MKAATRFAAVILALVVARAAPGVAQDARLERLAPDTRAQVTTLIDSARVAGLPVEPLVERALEGTSKGASAALIARAVRRLAADLGQARDALGPSAGAREVAAGADALRAGAPPGVLARLRDALGAERLVVPLGVTADLISRGVAPDTAANLTIGRARMVSDTELLALQRDLERDIALGAAPLTAATERLGASAEAAGAPGATGAQIPSPPVRRKP